MIEIYGVNLSQLPDRRGMISLLNENLYDAWRDRHRSIRDELATRASLAGMFLLQIAGQCGKLAYGEDGRPYFTNSKVDFNITHTDQQVFCAIEVPDESVENEILLDPTFPVRKVAPHQKRSLFDGQSRVGLDAENLHRVAHVRICPLADRWFSENELDFFLSDPTDTTFLRVWTRKESLIKWTGEGLRALRAADTISAQSLYDVRFCEYRVGNTLVTLCCHSTAMPAQEVHMITNSEILNGELS